MDMSATAQVFVPVPGKNIRIDLTEKGSWQVLTTSHKSR